MEPATVVAKLLAVVRGDDGDGVLVEAPAAQRLEELAQAPVRGRDLGVVQVDQVKPPGLVQRGPPGGELVHVSGRGRRSVAREFGIADEAGAQLRGRRIAGVGLHVVGVEEDRPRRLRVEQPKQLAIDLLCADGTELPRGGTVRLLHEEVRAFIVYAGLERGPCVEAARQAALLVHVGEIARHTQASVAGSPEQLGHGLDIGGERRQEGQRPVLRGQAGREERGDRGLRPGAWCARPSEAHPACGERIQLRRRVALVPIGAHVVGAQRIDDDQDEVGGRSGGNGGGRTGEQERCPDADPRDAGPAEDRRRADHSSVPRKIATASSMCESGSCLATVLQPFRTAAPLAG